MDYAIVCAVVAVLLTVLWSMALWKKRFLNRATFQKQYSHDNGRPLGGLEKVMVLGHDTCGHLILANALVLRSKKPITAPVVRKAMELLMKRHPMLRMCIKKEQHGQHCLLKMANVHVDLRKLDTKDWKGVMEDSLLEKFDVEDGPLWRVTFLPNARYEPNTEEDISADMSSYPHECICVFGFHHIVIDGPSYARMFAEFMKYIGKVSNNEDFDVTSMPLLPPMDLYIDEVISSKWYHHILQLVLELLCTIPGFIKLMANIMQGEGNAFCRKHGVEIQRNPHIQPKTKFIPVEFSNIETSRLLKMCKEHGATVQGAVQTSAGVAMATMLEEKEWVVPSGVTVNIRSFLKSKVPDDYAGPYFLFLQCKYMVVSSPDANKFWSMARQASDDIHARLNQNEHMKIWSTIKCMSPVMNQMSARLAKTKDDRSGQRSSQLIVFTNLGYAKFLDKSPDDDVILRARFGCSAEHQHGFIFANNLVTFNGKLFWTVTYYSNIVKDSTAQKYADLVKETIVKATEAIKE